MMEKFIGYCGVSGHEVDLSDKSLITSCYAMGTGEKQHLTFSFVCPKCRAHTTVTYRTLTDPGEFIKNLNLYTTGFLKLEGKAPGHK